MSGAALAGRLEPARWLPVAALGVLCALAGLVAGIDPSWALAGAFGLAFAFVAFTSLTAGLVVYTLIIFVEPGLLGKVLLASQLVLTVGWLARISAADGVTLFGRHRGAAFVLVLLLAWAATSVAWAGDTSAATTDLSRYAINLLLFAIVYTAVQTRSQAAWVIGAYLFSTAVLSFVGPAIRPDFLGPGGDPSFEMVEDRFVGGLADPNELAALLLPAIALGFGAAAALRGAALLRVLALAAAVVCLTTFFLTASRGGLVGFAVALVVAVAVGGRWRGKVALAGFAATALALVYFGLVAAPDVRERILEPTRGETRLDLSRLTLWDVGARMVSDRPLLGVGVGNYEQAQVSYVLEPGATYRTDAVVDERQPAHNTYLHVLAELGIPGFVLFSGVIVFALGCTGRAIRVARARDDVSIEAISRALLVGQTGMLVAIFFFSAQSVNKLWLVLALGPALLAIARHDPAEQAPASRAQTPRPPTPT